MDFLSQRLMTLPIKRGKMGLPNPVLMVEPSYLISVEVTQTLMEALQKGDQDTFDLAEYNKVGQTAKELVVGGKRVAQGEELEKILAGKTERDRHRIRRLVERSVDVGHTIPSQQHSPNADKFSQQPCPSLRLPHRSSHPL